MSKSPMMEKFRGMRENTPENALGSGQPSYDVQAGGWMPDVRTNEDVMTEAPVGHSDPSGESYTSQKYRDEVPDDNPAMSMESVPDMGPVPDAESYIDGQGAYIPPNVGFYDEGERDLHQRELAGQEIGMMAEPAPQYPQGVVGYSGKNPIIDPDAVVPASGNPLDYQAPSSSVYGDAPFDQPAMEEDRIYNMDGSEDTQDPRLSKIFGKYNPYGAANPYGPSAANPYLRKYG